LLLLPFFIHIDLGEIEASIGINTSLLVDSFQAFDSTDIESILKDVVTRMIGFASAIVQWGYF